MDFRIALRVANARLFENLGLIVFTLLLMSVVSSAADAIREAQTQLLTENEESHHPSNSSVPPSKYRKLVSDGPLHYYIPINEKSERYSHER